MGNYYEDFNIGDTINHALSKTIFESDNNLFCLLTMNSHPLHTNKEYASKQQHGEIVVVGTLVFSLAVGITVQDISGKAIANLEYSKVKHLYPVYIGDTLHVTSTIIEKRETKKTDRGIIVVQSHVYNQNDNEVLYFERKVLVKRKSEYHGK